MKTLYIFNPEHDIALASGLANFTAPHAGRQLRSDLGFLPVLWADEDDYVLVDHVESAEKSCRRLLSSLGKKYCRFVDKHEIGQLDIVAVEPWGWDLALSSMLRRKGVNVSILPSLETLVKIRQLSHRRTSAHLLSRLQMDGTVGIAYECSQEWELQNLRKNYGQLVLKAPWSSSGRGVRFDDNLAWVTSVIQRQGSVMVEPYYNKVKDFGMEFTATDNGIVCNGLSLFHTKNGAYVGNVLATEQAKRVVLSKYVSMNLLDSVRDRICNTLDLQDYRGPFGVDMMVCQTQTSTNDKSYLLHPCVEINLRRTMGHVALSVGEMTNPTNDDDIRGVMRVMYNGTNYQLKIRKRI